MQAGERVSGDVGIGADREQGEDDQRRDQPAIARQAVRRVGRGAGQAPGKDRVDLGVIDKARPVVRTTIGAKDRTIVSSQRLVTEEPGRAIDVGGSLSLTRNLNVTAGVRYRSERDRLPQLTNEGRDSQAVYVGTAFRF